MTRFQATVAVPGADGSVTLVRDDGTSVHAAAGAVRAGGWHAARPGQRVLVELDDTTGAIVAVLLPTGERT